MFERSILKTVDFARGAWRLVLKKKGSITNINFLGSALKKDLFISIFFVASFDVFFDFLFDFFFDFFFVGSCFSSIAILQFVIMAVISGSYRRCANADWRRFKDGFRIRFAAIDLERIHLKSGLEVESTVRCTEGELVTGGRGYDSCLLLGEGLSWKCLMRHLH